MLGHFARPLGRIGAGVALACAVLLALVASSALAAIEGSDGLAPTPPAPALRITVTPGPTNFAPGDSSGEDVYQVTAVNIGGAPTTGTITLSDSLPPGLTLNSSGPGGFDDNGNTLSCSDGPPITCSDPNTLQPGQAVGMRVPVDIAPESAPSVTDEAGVSGGGAPNASADDATTISATPASFGFQSTEALLTNAQGTAETQAGSHPYALDLRFALNEAINAHLTEALRPPAQDPRDLTVNLPAGVVVNPNATPVKCTEAELESAPACPLASQVGTIRVTLGVLYQRPGTDLGGNSDIGANEPLFNMVPPAGVPSDFGFDAAGAGIYVHLLGSVRTGGDYGLTATADDIDQKAQITAASATLWGNPSNPIHNDQRGTCAHVDGEGQLNSQGGYGCESVEPTQRPLLTMPSACSGPPVTTITGDSWQNPGDFLPLQGFETTSLEGAPVGVSGCELLAFNPSLSVKPEPESVATSSPSGLNVDLKVPQEESQEGLAEANLRNATVTLPAGVTVSPSAANGLGACGPAEIGLDDAAQPSCPQASKIGTAEIVTPLLEQPLQVRSTWPSRGRLKTRWSACTSSPKAAAR